MRHDSGYFEEKQLGKTYDTRLLKRLIPFLKPYHVMILASIFLVMLITLLDLSIPYITKIAIDGYIVPKIGIQSFEGDQSDSNPTRSRSLTINPEDPEVRAIMDRHPDLFKTAEQGTIITYQDLAKLNKGEITLLRQESLSGIARISLVFLIIIILSFGLNFLQRIVMEYTGHMMMNDLRLELFDHIQHLSLSFFTKNPVGRLVTRVTNDIQNMHELFTSVISLVFKDLLLLVGIAVVMIFMNWKLALFSFLVLPLVLYTSFAFSGRIRDTFRELRVKIAEINTKFSEMIDGINVIQSFGKEDVAADNFARLNHENYLAGMRQINVLAIFMPLIEVFGVATVAVIIFFGGGSVLEGHISLGVLVAFISYMRMFYRPIRDLAEKYNILQNALASAERIFLILDTENTTDAIHTGTGVPSKSEKEIKSIRIENMSFSYTASEMILNHISFTIHSGETVAIIGPTGSGKTSLANLLMRFYDPVSGKILLDGQNIRGIPISEYRSKIALVTQEPFLFTDSVQANIWRDQPLVTAEEIQRVLKASNCNTFVEGLEEGVHTRLTSGGASLSSGQRQLMSIARAFARDPELIILDEATSYIDSLTEDAIQDALSKLMKGRTTLVIAHRLSTVRSADKIIVLDKGKILEMGNHEVLMQKEGVYFRMNHLQHCLGNTC